MFQNERWNVFSQNNRCIKYHTYSKKIKNVLSCWFSMFYCSKISRKYHNLITRDFYNMN